MSDLAMLEPILNKLSGVNAKLDEIYQLVDDIKELKSDMNNTLNSSKNKNAYLLSKYENYFRDADFKLNQLNGSFSEKLKDLEKSKEEVDLILEIYQEQQEKIDAALTFLNTQKTSSESLQQQLTQAFDGLDSNIQHKIEEFKIVLQSGINNFYPEVERKVDNILDKLTIEKEGLKLFTNETKENLIAFNLEKNKLISDISEVNDKAEKTKIFLSQKIDTGLNKILEDQSSFVDYQNKLIDNLSPQVDTLQRICEKDRNEKTEIINNLNNYIQTNIEPKLKYCETELIRGNILKVRIEKIESYLAEKSKGGIFGIFK